MAYWLFKSEGACYSIDDLKQDKKTAWTGVRNFQARNFMMKDMSIGDTVFFYHSNGSKAEPTGIYGLAKVASKAHVDETQFDKKDEHYDSKSSKDSPIWWCVDIIYVKKSKEPIALSYIKIDPNLKDILVAQKGSRLSIQPVSERHGAYICMLIDEQ